jgi:type II secretory pathway pseudopilin PulG
MNKKGFTFIEVIIIFTIVFIMTAILLGTSYKDRSKKEISTVAREVAATIRETQNNALTGKQKENDKMPCAFKFEFQTHSYEIRRSFRGIDDVCPPDTNDGVDQVFSKIIQLPKDVQINSVALKYNDSTSADEDNIIFLVPYGDFIVTSRDGSDNDFKGIDVRIERSDGSEKYHICVHATGLIEELGFNNEEYACAF